MSYNRFYTMRLISDWIDESEEEEEDDEEEEEEEDELEKEQRRRDKEEAEKFRRTVVDNYNRDSDPHDDGEDFKEYAKIAIDHYNKIEDTDYVVVDMVRVSSSLCAGMMWYMTFTSKRLLQGDDAAVTFEASVYMGIDETEVSSVHMLDEESGQENPERKMKTETIEEPVEEPPTILEKYDRDHNAPELGVQFKEYADLAIYEYDFVEVADYIVVDVVKVSSSQSSDYTMWYVMFTAKRPEQDDAAAVTFKASVYEGIYQTLVEDVDMLDQKSGQEKPSTIEESVEEKPERNKEGLFPW